MTLIDELHIFFFLSATILYYLTIIIKLRITFFFNSLSSSIFRFRHIFSSVFTYIYRINNKMQKYDLHMTMAFTLNNFNKCTFSNSNNFCLMFSLIC